VELVVDIIVVVGGGGAAVGILHRHLRRDEPGVRAKLHQFLHVASIVVFVVAVVLRPPSRSVGVVVVFDPVIVGRRRRRRPTVRAEVCARRMSHPRSGVPNPQPRALDGPSEEGVAVQFQLPGTV
jgi:hypothetical protein